MKVITFDYNSFDELLANTYLVIDESNAAVIVDPSKEYDGIINYINKNNISLKAILITHAHFDHIGGVRRLLDTFNVAVYAGYEEVESFTSPYLNCSTFAGSKPFSVNINVTPLGDNQILKILNEDIKVLYTPYHTSGSVCYYFDESKLLFSGDSLFFNSLGRSDLPTSVPNKTISSIKKLMELNDEVKVYPGHGKTTSIGIERKHLSYLNY